MLNELETLSHNIGRLIAINEHAQRRCHALEETLAQVRHEHGCLQAELAQLHEAHQALQTERDALAAKIDEAQMRLNAIIEKLPRAKTPCATADEPHAAAEATSTAGAATHSPTVSDPASVPGETAWR